MTELGLCKTCEFSHIVVTDRGQRVTCGWGERRMLDGTVRECNRYHNENETSLRRMEQIAWVLVTDKSKTIGFKPAREWRLDNPNEIMLPDQ